MTPQPQMRIKLQIPEPCTVPWESMTPAENSQRHCASCAKNVIDFSTMSDDEILHFFQANTGNVCGRLRVDQLNRQLAKPVHYTRPANWWKRAAVLPLLLLSKEMLAQARYANARARDKNETVQLDSMQSHTTIDLLAQTDSIIPTSVDTIHIAIDSLRIDTSRLGIVRQDSLIRNNRSFAIRQSKETFSLVLCAFYKYDPEFVLGGLGFLPYQKSPLICDVVGNVYSPPEPWYHRPFNSKLDLKTFPMLKAAFLGLPFFGQFAALTRRIRIRRRKRQETSP